MAKMGNSVEQHSEDNKKWFDKLPQWNGTVMQWRHIPQFLEQEIPQLYKPLVKIIAEYFGGCPFDEFIGAYWGYTSLNICNYCAVPGNKIAIFGSYSRNCVKYKYSRICDLCWPYGGKKEFQCVGSDFY